MNLQNLTKIKKRTKRRLGQGHGSGRVKTSGRGTKGQKARGKISLSFEGGAVSLIKRLPFRRGKDKNKAFKKAPIIINIKVLNLLPKNSIVDIKTLVQHRIVDENQAKSYGVKILGEGEIKVPLTVRLKTSKKAAEKIKKAGGKIDLG
ncbi:MAG: 50S ribosomal protein L15 [Candidatus Levyibacteriota bacterium]